MHVRKQPKVEERTSEKQRMLAAGLGIVVWPPTRMENVYPMGHGVGYSEGYVLTAVAEWSSNQRLLWFHLTKLFPRNLMLSQNKV